MDLRRRHRNAVGHNVLKFFGQKLLAKSLDVLVRRNPELLLKNGLGLVVSDEFTSGVEHRVGFEGSLYFRARDGDS